MAYLISDLEICHAEYNPVVCGNLRALETYADFYSGGRDFERNKSKYLRTRPIDSQPGGSNHRNYRLGCAYFTPHCGGIGDNLCGTALQYPPTIDVKTLEDKRAEYWRRLNANLDGLGSDTRSVAWALMYSLLIHKRAYLVVNFPKTGDDATFCALSARDVDDWEKDSDGKYLWLRTHCVDLVRSKGEYAPQDTELHTWTFYSETDTQEFTAERKIGEKWQKEAAATTGPKVPHGLGVVPVFPIEVEDKFWVMDRLWSTANAYFNREASRAFSIDTGAHVLPVIKTNRDVTSIVTADGSAIRLNADTAEDFFWATPDAGIYAALKDDCDYLLSNLYSALNQMALTAAGMAGNPRQSGTAKTADASAIKAFLSLLCSPIMRAFRNAFKAVQSYRNEEDLDVDVTGMSNFDVQSIELEINRCLTFVAIPGMPETAKKESLRRAIRAYLPDISDDEKEEINDELENPPEPVIGTEAAAGQSITNATTGRPQGFAPGQVSQKFGKGGNSLTKTA